MGGGRSTHDTPGRPGLNDVVLNACSLVCTPAAGPPRTRPAAREGRVDDGSPFEANGRPAAPTEGPRPIREGVDLTPPFDAKGRRLLLGKGPVSRFLKCVQKSMSSGHRVSSGRSTREAGAPHFPNTALRTDCGASRYSGDVRLVMQTAPGTFGTTLTSGHRAPPCTPRSMLGR